MASLRESLSRFLSPRIEAVGLEVGTSALKVVELRGGNPPSLATLAMRAMPPGLIQEDQVVDAQGLADEIKALFDEAGFLEHEIRPVPVHRGGDFGRVAYQEAVIEMIEKLIAPQMLDVMWKIL